MRLWKEIHTNRINGMKRFCVTLLCCLLFFSEKISVRLLLRSRKEKNHQEFKFDMRMCEWKRETENEQRHHKYQRMQSTNHILPHTPLIEKRAANDGLEMFANRRQRTN